MRYWQGEALKLIVLSATVLAVGGAVALLVIGVLANGGGRSDLHLNWILLVLVIAHCLAQIWLGIAGCRSALRWIDWRQEKPAPFAGDGETI
jgi:hypothetical protein